MQPRPTKLIWSAHLQALKDGMVVSHKVRDEEDKVCGAGCRIWHSRATHRATGCGTAYTSVGRVITSPWFPIATLPGRNGASGSLTECSTRCINQNHKQDTCRGFSPSLRR